jgi:hypothetical protein
VVWRGGKSKPRRVSRSQIMQKFFGSFFQKRTERQRFFLKKEAKTFVCFGAA